MKYLKRGIALLLAAIFCLSMAACGKDKEENDDNIAGEDWRTTGVVFDYGTITIDGENTEVCVCIDDSKATFFYDDAEQVYFDEAVYPMNLPDAQSAYGGTFFDDLNGDGNSDVSMDFYHEDGSETNLIWYWEGDQGFVFQPDMSSVSVSGGEDLAQFVGLWEYVGENIWLHVYEDATWSFVNSADEVIESGVVLADSTGMELHYDGSGDVLRLELTVSEDLLDTANDGMLVRVDSIEQTLPYFETHGIEMNAEVDGGSYLLENGVCSYSNLGDGYNTDDCYWEVTMNRDETHDGIRELQFDAVCYIPNSSIPSFSETYITNVTCDLYDYYTGIWLTDSAVTGDTERGDNYYVHTIEWNGQSYQIEHAYSTEWQYNVGDWAMIMTKSYVAYMPEDYNGLIFVGLTQQDNYADCAKHMQLDSICPEAPLMEVELTDPYSALYFDLCR